MGVCDKWGEEMTHELKILPKYFDAVNCGKKNFEIRINDRDYQEHDELVLKEWYRGKYTGRECHRWVGYIYHGDGTYGIAENTVVMALKRSAPMKSIDGADLTEATATANHFFGREGQEADRKTEPTTQTETQNSNLTFEKVDEPQTCETCKWGEWYRKGYDITMMSDECGGCCSWNNKWKPKAEPQTDASCVECVHRPIGAEICEEACHYEPKTCDADCNEDCAECAKETELWKQTDLFDLMNRFETLCNEIKLQLRKSSAEIASAVRETQNHDN